MTKQDEEAKREILRSLRGPGSSAHLAHNLALARKVEVIGEKNKLLSVLMRTFLISFPDFPILDPPNSPKIPFGSAFALDYQGRQYLITASHVIKFDGKSPGDKGTIHIQMNNEPNPLEVTVVGRGDASKTESDIAVLAANIHLPIPDPFLEESFEPSIDIGWGDRAYFCGFPYGQYIKTDVIEGHPLAMTKGAVLSGMRTESGTLAERKKGLFILDGYNNGGFSGGPAVFQLGEDQNVDFQVFGIVSSYQLNKAAVMHEDAATGLITMENAGLIECPSIMRAIDMIEANPIGFEISTP